MRVSVITPPSAEPVTLTEAKAHLRVDITTDDALISALITAAREWCEAYCNRAIGLQKLEVAYPDFYEVIELPRPPFRSVEHIKYLDQDGALQTLATDVYRVIESADTWPAQLERAPTKSWEVTTTSAAAVRVTYWAGWDTEGSPADVIPESIKAAIKLVVGDLYEHREAQLDMEVYKNPTVERLLNPHRCLSL